MVTPRRVVFRFDERSLEPLAKLMEQERSALEGCACPLCALWHKGVDDWKAVGNGTGAGAGLGGMLYGAWRTVVGS
jgi:hypothetical protein